MKKLSIFILSLTILLTVGVFFNANSAQAALDVPDSGEAVEQAGNEDQLSVKKEKLPVYFFWGDGCPHCHDEMVFLQKIKGDYPQIEFQSFETWNNDANYQLLLKMSKEVGGARTNKVPYLLIGDESVLGFSSEDTTGVKIRQLLDIYILNIGENATSTPAEITDIVKYPFLGNINVNDLSLPALTAVLGTLDGFNPCSMWALMILITLLINSGSKKKMWIVGGVFILVSAISYFLFLTIWLNAFLSFGDIAYIKTGIALLAVGVGIYFLRDFWLKRKLDALTCDVASSETKNKIIARLESALNKESLFAMIVGVVIAAFSVNLIEFVCSAGIPTIYTKILSSNDLSTAGYYLYLLVYDFFYMLDDIVVLLIAGFTWQLFLSSGKYTKYSHLIGGILLLILGVIMLFNPNLLMF
jgi:thiol-disulfide isomerase/thioredoxin